ncbi:hypothetical protein [Nonomuraea helvata]|uniref:Uncharacterized protein n=1 Tax=Nonomuraea helvata TaxID=37484 RepID=A0ABV5SAA0_9ACTN
MSLEMILGERRLAGRAELAEAMRILASQAVPGDAAGELGDVPPGAFHEPRLYSQLVRPGFESMTLAQLLYGGLAERPAVIVARTDAAGVLSLPGVGTLATGLPGAEVRLRRDEAARAFVVRDAGGESRTCALRPSAFAAGMEIVGWLDPMLGRFLADHMDDAQELVLVDDPRRYQGPITRALDLIAVVRPEFHVWLVESLRGVLLFRHPHAESFAALGMHGMIFLNVPRQTTAAYFVEQLTHQGGHVVFSEATLRRADFFLVDPETPLAEWAGRDDPRTVYDAFHGLYTEHMETQVYRAILEQGPTSRDESADLRELLATTAKRHAADLELIAPHARRIFSDTGLTVFAEFQSSRESETHG